MAQFVENHFVPELNMIDIRLLNMLLIFKSIVDFQIKVLPTYSKTRSRVVLLLLFHSWNRSDKV